MERLGFAATACFAALICSGCELGTDLPGSDAVSISSRTDSSCPSTTGLRTVAAAGATCEVSGDCAEVCCTCSASTKVFAAAACIQGTCAASATTCAKAEENRPSLCE